MKILIVLALILIILSLGSALYHLVMDREKTQKTAKALTLRIGLSIGLFLLLLLAFASGWIQPHGLRGIKPIDPESNSVPRN